MSFDTPGRVNPFEAPRAGIGGRAADLDLGDVSGAEIVRRAHLNHEASVKALGALQYIGAIICAVFMAYFFAAAAGMAQGFAAQPGMSPEQMRIFFGVIGGVLFVVFFLYAALGYGLRNLQVWARWVIIVLTSLSLLVQVLQIVMAAAVNPAAAAGVLVASVIPFLINGYILYLVASAKGGVVFSRQYKDVIRKTPHIRYRTSIIVKIFLVLLLVVIVIGVMALLFAPRP